jgi:hypothetical protein
MDELQRILERQVVELASRILGHPEGTALDRSAESHLCAGLRRHERMFPQQKMRRCLSALPLGSQTHDNPKGGDLMAMGVERTKEQLYREAKRLNIKGRSKMTKGQLKAALARKGH